MFLLGENMMEIEVGSLYRRIKGNGVIITSDGKVHEIKLGDIITFLELIREAKDSKTWKILTLDGILGTS